MHARTPITPTTGSPRPTASPRAPARADDGRTTLPRRSLLASSIAFSLALAGCGGGGGGGNGSDSTAGGDPAPGDGVTAAVSLRGGAVKGPLRNARFAIHAVDPAQPDGRGELLARGRTDDRAGLSGVRLPADTEGLILFEFTGDADVVDLTTGTAPAIERLRTIMPAREVLRGGQPAFATPMTSMAVDVALANADRAEFGGDGNGTVTEAELRNALASAQARVKGVFGFDLLGDVDLFDTVPVLIAGRTDSDAEQRAVARHRTAIEALASLSMRVAEAIETANGDDAAPVTTEAAFRALGDDLTDGVLDGSGTDGTIETYGSDGLAAAVDQVRTTDPNGLPIENDPQERSVSSARDILIAERGALGNEAADAGAVAAADTDAAPANVAADSDDDGVADRDDDDDDGDGTPDADDAFPLDASEDTDTDGDGIGDNADTDDDNDGTPDADDAFPLDASEDTDTDNDGIGNNADTDDDGDGIADVDDAFPLDASEGTDTDGDGIGDAADTDDDNDGTPDSEDAFPLDASEDTDTDGDGIGDNADTDDDNDGTQDTNDAFPLDPNEDTDTDGDGIGDNADDTPNGGSGDDETGAAVDIEFSPRDQKSNVSLSRTVSFTASTDLDPASVTNDTFVLTGPGGEIGAGVDYDNGIATLDPSGELSPATSYTMQVTTGVTTADGTPIESAQYASFTTVAASALPPLFEEWEREMNDAGRTRGQAIQNETDYGRKLDMQYYDAQRVFEQIGDYRGEVEPWRSYGQAAEDVYKSYLESADFRAAGYMRFPHGLGIDGRRTGDSESLEYIELLRDRPPFSYPTGYEDKWVRQKYSREIAYSIESHMVAERAGYPRQTSRLNTLVDMALGHIDIWVTKDYLDPDSSWHFCQAFMTGLTASALIDYYERSVELGDPDERIQPAVERVADFIWNEMWVSNVNGSGYGAFEYVQPTTSGVGSESPAPDLNQLIAPMFAWLYLQTGDGTWLQRGDAVFAGGVALADLGSGKRFNQSYRTSFDFVEWRAEAIEKHGTP